MTFSFQGTGERATPQEVGKRGREEYEEEEDLQSNDQNAFFNSHSPRDGNQSNSLRLEGACSLVLKLSPY